MNWSTCLSLLSFVVFSTQIVFGMEQVETPWSSAQIAENFIAYFLRAVSLSNVFSPSQLNAISPIQKTLADAMELFNVSNMNPKTKFQALNMVFASAVAEIIVSENSTVSIETKIKEIENALISAFQEATGIRNSQFVSDIKNLIFTLTHAKAIEVPDKPIVKAEDDKQGSSGQPEISTSAKSIEAVGSPPQQGPRIAQEGQSAVYPSTTQNPNRGSKVTLIRGNSPRFFEFEPQRSSPTMSSIQAQDGRKTLSTNTGNGLKPLLPLASTSRLNGIGQETLGDYNQIIQKSSNEAKYGAIRQGLNSNGPVDSGSSGENSITKGLQRPQWIGVIGPDIPKPLKTVSQGSGEYEMRTQVPDLVPQNEQSIGAVSSLKGRSSISKEQDQVDSRSSVDVDQRPEVYESGKDGLDRNSEISGGVTGVEPDVGTGEKQKSQEISGKNTEIYRGSGSRVADALNYNPGIATEIVQEENQDIQGSSTREIQDEKEIQRQIPSGQRYNNQRQYDLLYRGPSQIRKPGLESSRLLESSSQSETYGSNDYPSSSAAAPATAASDTSVATGLVRERSNGPTLNRNDGYRSEISTPMAELAAGRDAFTPPIAARILPPAVSSSFSPIVPRNPSENSALSNIVDNIVSRVGTVSPESSYCNAHIQTMLEIIADLVHLLGYCN